MFPISAFEEEDALPMGPPMPGEEDDRVGNLTNDNDARRSSLGNNRAEYHDIYNSTNGHGVMNLKELDAYVQDTVRAQRQQRRREVLIKVALSLSFVVIATGVFSSSFYIYKDRTNNSSSSSSSNKQKDPEHAVHFRNPLGYVLSHCEVELNQNRSFLELIAETQLIDDDSHSACRREVPDCEFENPTIPAKRHDDNSALRAEWNYAFEFNVRHIQGMTKRVTTERHPIDVVLIGDSIVEHWEGKDMGINEPSLHRDHEVFEELFTKHGGGQLDGMAHGIGGDRCANLLWRLENGEMPPEFDPKVWWVLIGTEDWFVGVDSEAIVAGIIKIVMTIRQAHPSTHIVVNSILPRGNEKRDENPHYAALFDINQRLDCYVKSENNRRKQKLASAGIVPKHEILSFFNATSIFLFRDPEVGYFVNPALLPDYVHPSAQGEEIWGAQIVDKVLELTGREPIPPPASETEEATTADTGATPPPVAANDPGTAANEPEAPAATTNTAAAGTNTATTPPVAKPVTAVEQPKPESPATAANTAAPTKPATNTATTPPVTNPVVATNPAVQQPKPDTTVNATVPVPAQPTAAANTAVAPADSSVPPTDSTTTATATAATTTAPPNPAGAATATATPQQQEAAATTTTSSLAAAYAKALDKTTPATPATPTTATTPAAGSTATAAATSNTQAVTPVAPATTTTTTTTPEAAQASATPKAVVASPAVAAPQGAQGGQP